jgi:GR25 family glycosyltransferase involved in LPS biosynthesis
MEIKSFVINLDRETDRWKSVLLEIEKIGTPVKRVEAVDMKLLAPDQNPFVTSGVYACWESHRKIYREFIDTGGEYALIFEDDFFIKHPRVFHSALRDIQASNWDIAQIGFVSPGIRVKLRIILGNLENFLLISFSKIAHRKPFKWLRLENRMRVREARKAHISWIPDDFQPGTHCYAISRDCAMNVLEMNDPQFLSADDFFMALAKMRIFQMKRYFISIVGQKKFPKFPGERFKRFEA